MLKIKFDDIKEIKIINEVGGIDVTQLKKKYNPDAILNLALYDNKTKQNIVKMIADKKESGYLFSDHGVGIKNNKLIQSDFNDKLDNHISGAPLLIKDSKINIDWGNKHSPYVDGKHYRSALGFTENEIILNVTKEKQTIPQLATNMLNIGCKCAINLDGGGSCHLEHKDKIIKKTTRSNASWLLIYLKKENKTMKFKRLIDGSTMGTAKVTIDILPKGKVVPDASQTVTHITIHNTGGYASAKNNHTYMKRNNTTGEGATSSWHITVDEKDIYQAQSFNYKMYHAGDAKGNNCSVGIEICQSKDPKVQEQIYRNASEVVKYIMDMFDLPISRVVKHQHWSGKKCPDFLIRSVYGYSWDWFISLCKEDTPKVDKPKVDASKQYCVKIEHFNFLHKAIELSNKLTLEKEFNKIYEDKIGYGIKVYPFSTKDEANKYSSVIKTKYNCYSKVNEL